MTKRYESPHPLFGCQLKLDRAYEHTEALYQAVDAFIRRDPYETALEPEIEAGQYLAVMKVRDAPPLWWSVLIGDIVHNLRSALDHLAYQLVVANGKRPQKSAYPIFSEDPFAPDASERALETWQTMTKGIHPDDIATIKETQPYGRRNLGDLHPLLVLNRLSNRDKHRELQLTASVLVGSRFEFTAVQDCELGETKFGHHGAFEHGTVVATCSVLRFTGNNPKVNMQAALAYGVAFAEGSPTGLEQREITKTLMWLANQVHDIVHEFAVLSPRFESFKQD